MPRLKKNRCFSGTPRQAHDLKMITHGVFGGGQVRAQMAGDKQEAIMAVRRELEEKLQQAREDSAAKVHAFPLRRRSRLLCRRFLRYAAIPMRIRVPTPRGNSLTK